MSYVSVLGLVTMVGGLAFAQFNDSVRQGIEAEMLAAAESRGDGVEGPTGSLAGEVAAASAEQLVAQGSWALAAKAGKGGMAAARRKHRGRGSSNFDDDRRAGGAPAPTRDPGSDPPRDRSGSDDSPDSPSCSGPGCGAGTTCFIAGTLVTTATGVKPIEAVTVGERVLSFDDGSSRVAQRDTLPNLPPASQVSEEWIVSFDLSDGHGTAVEHLLLRGARAVALEDGSVRNVATLTRTDRVRLDHGRVGLVAALIPSWEPRSASHTPAPSSSGEPTLSRVLGTVFRTTEVLTIVRTARDAIVATPEHPFMRAGAGWTEASRLSQGDLVERAYGEPVSVLSVETRRVPPTRVYNMQVEGTQTYYVGPEAVLVHNVTGCTEDPENPSNDPPPGNAPPGDRPRNDPSSANNPRNFDTAQMTPSQVQEDKDNGVYYLTEKEREELRVEVRDGRLVNKRGEPIAATGKGEVEYVMGTDGSIYIAKPHPNGIFNHSQFLGDAPVAGAGMIRVGEDGKVTYIDNKSGHFKPTPGMTNQVVDVLRDGGLEVADPTEHKPPPPPNVGPPPKGPPKGGPPPGGPAPGAGPRNKKGRNRPRVVDPSLNPG